jgi:hypothetical protein
MDRFTGLFAASLVAAACAGPSTVATPCGAVFVVTPTPDWSRFRRVVVEAPRIDYAARSARPGAADEQRLRHQLRAMLARTFEDALGWEVVDEGAEADVRARVVINGLELAAPPTSPIRTTAFQSPTGRVGFALELEDAARGTPLFAFGERRPLPGGTFVGPPWTELQRTREAFRRFTRDVRAALLELGVSRGSGAAHDRPQHGGGAR